MNFREFKKANPQFSEYGVRRKFEQEKERQLMERKNEAIEKRKRAFSHAFAAQGFDTDEKIRILVSEYPDNVILRFKNIGRKRLNFFREYFRVAEYSTKSVYEDPRLFPCKN